MTNLTDQYIWRRDALDELGTVLAAPTITVRHLRSGTVSPLAAAKHSLRALARCWRHLHAEITEHEALLEQLVRDTTPQLVEAFDIGADNPERVRGETAWAKLCGVAPDPGLVRHDRPAAVEAISGARS